LSELTRYNNSQKFVEWLEGIESRSKEDIHRYVPSSLAILFEHYAFYNHPELLMLLLDVFLLFYRIAERKFRDLSVLCQRSKHLPGTKRRVLRRSLYWREMVAYCKQVMLIQNLLGDTKHSSFSPPEWPIPAPASCLEDKGDGIQPEKAYLNTQWNRTTEASCLDEAKVGIKTVIDSLERRNIPSADLKEVKAYLKRNKLIMALFTLNILYGQFRLFGCSDMVQMLKCSWRALLVSCLR